MTAAAQAPVTVRVTVADTWSTVAVTAGAGESAATVKLKALAAVQMDPARAGRYELKFGGALVRDESQPLSALGVRNGAALVVLSRQRRPVR